MDSKVREDPFAKESVVSPQAERAQAISKTNRQQATNLAVARREGIKSFISETTKGRRLLLKAKLRNQPTPYR
jgi:hypothetical protein